MTETFPLHRCVYRNDQVALIELLKNEEIKKQINEKDNHGNTPLNLAVMLGRRNCIITLINSGSDVYCCNDFGWNILDEAFFLGDVDIIEKISILGIRTVTQYFSKEILKKWNEVLPTVFLRSKIKIKSPIPVLAKIMGSETIDIYKKGDYFRLNTSIAGYSLKGIPRIKKGNMSILIRFYPETDSCKCIILDNKKKTYQETYPAIPQWCVSDMVRRYIDIKTLYKVFPNFTNCSIKHKKGGLLKKSKKTIQTTDGKTYKVDLYKVKGVKAIIRKRDDEAIIGEYKSDIRTKVLHHSSDKNKSLALNSNEKIQSSSASIMSNDSTSDLSDLESTFSDNESSYSEEEEKEEIIDISKENLNDNANHDSLFKKYIKNNVIDSETEKIITEIIMNGEDSEHNKIHTNDLLYLSSNYPEFIEKFLNKPVSRKHYVKMLKNLRLEDANRINNDGTTTEDIKEQYSSEFKRKSKIKATEDPNVAFYRIISGIPTEEDINISKNEEKTRLKNFDWSKNKISEEDYFDPSNTEKIHLGRIMNVTENTKKSKYIKLWMSQKDEFPISFSHLGPVFDYINRVLFDCVIEQNNSNDDNKTIFYKNNEFFNHLYNERRFPLKIDFPIYPTIKMVMKTLECSVDPEKVPDEIFKIPSDYVEDDVLFEMINRG